MKNKTWMIAPGFYTETQVVQIAQMSVNRQVELAREAWQANIVCIARMMSLINDMIYITGLVTGGERQTMLEPHITEQTGQRLTSKLTSVIYAYEASAIKDAVSLDWLAKAVGAYTAAIGAFLREKDNGAALREAANTHIAELVSASEADYIINALENRPIIGGQRSDPGADWLFAAMEQYKGKHTQFKYATAAQEFLTHLRAKAKNSSASWEYGEKEALQWLESHNGIGKLGKDLKNLCDYKKRG